MNYRHIYHAGNFADVFKHAFLSNILQYLLKKSTPFRVIDTHAGLGFYDVTSDEAMRTSEYLVGAHKLVGKELPVVFHAYQASITALNQRYKIKPNEILYPGSPWISRFYLREHDRLDLVELHPEDNALLRRNFGKDQQITIHEMDAYAALRALCPPPERRGLVLIDPPFEKTDEFSRCLNSLREALKRWATGIYTLWYPIKSRPMSDAFLAEVQTLGTKAFTAEFLRTSPSNSTGLAGCGMLILNPPWNSDVMAQQLLDACHAVFGVEETSGSRLQWLVDETGKIII